MDRLEQQVGEKEAQIKGRVAAMSAFEIEQDESLAMDQDVLGTEVAQHERAFRRADVHRGDQLLDPRSNVGMSLGGGAIVRVDPQLIEERGIGKGLAQGGVPQALGMNGSQCGSQPRGDAGIGLASHEQRLPGHRINRSTRHSKKVVGTVFKEDRWDHAGGQDGGKHIERGTLGPDAVEPRVPLHRDAQSLATLLDHDGRPSGNLTRKTTFETPPVNSLTTMAASLGALPVSRR